MLLVLVWILAKNHRSKPYFVFILSFFGSLLLPALVPAHGEFIIALPNAALFTVVNTMAWGVGLFYLVINFFICYAVLNIWQRYQDLK
ncbi:MAG: hypothetical protein COA83_02395 [Methylophaga sp.]|nr:MAG: hypothetical protein COA83_02395 [Methylophaga sp.]